MSSSQKKIFNNVLEKVGEVTHNAVGTVDAIVGPKAVGTEIINIVNKLYEPSSPMDPQKIQEQQSEEAEDAELLNRQRMILSQEMNKLPQKDPNELSKYHQAWKDRKDREEEEKQKQGGQAFQVPEGKRPGRPGQAAQKASTGFETKQNVKSG